MISRDDRLAAYLEEAAAEPWSWARANCLTFLTVWLSRERGYDGRRWLGAVESAQDYKRLIRKAGGTEALAARQAKAAGVERVTVDQASAGDVGLIRLRKSATKPGTVTLGCLKAPSGRWAVRTITGLVLLAAEEHGVEPHLVWRV